MLLHKQELPLEKVAYCTYLMQALRVSRSTLRIEGILLYGAHLMQHLPILRTLHDITALRKVKDLDGKKRCIRL